MLWGGRRSGVRELSPSAANLPKPLIGQVQDFLEMLDHLALDGISGLTIPPVTCYVTEHMIGEL